MSEFPLFLISYESPNFVLEIVQGSCYTFLGCTLISFCSFGGFSEIWHQSFKLEKKSSNFVLKTSLVHLGGSPDTIGKVSWPLKEASLEAKTFVLNLDKFEWKLQGALETSIFIRYASVIPFWKPLGVLMKLCTIWLTSEAIRGRYRQLKMKKMVFVTFECIVRQTPNFKLKPLGHCIGDPWKKK